MVRIDSLKVGNDIEFWKGTKTDKLYQGIIVKLHPGAAVVVIDDDRMVVDVDKITRKITKD